MTSSLLWGVRLALLCAFLAATFVTICFAGPVGVYVGLVAALASCLFTFDTVSLKQVVRDRGTQGFLLAFVIVWLSFLPSARTYDDVMAFVDFLAFPVVVPAAALLARYSGPKNISITAVLATIGALLALAIGMYEVRVLGQSRAQGNGNSSAIFFSGMAALLAFFSLLGLLSSLSKWRWLFLLGNAAGVGAILLGGTRGAMLAYAVLFLVFAAYTVSSKKIRIISRILTILIVLISTTLFVAALFDVSRLMSIFTTVSEAAAQKDVSDQATSLRLVIYSAAIQAFFESPIYGHGWWHRFEAAVPYMGQLGIEAYARDNRSHLHNDILNFGSAGGVIAILGYLVLMASPIVGAVRSPRTQNWGLRVTAAVGLVGAYLAMGAVDTMFVFEIPKSMYVLCSAVILGFFLDAPPTMGKEAFSRAG